MNDKIANGIIMTGSKLKDSSGYTGRTANGSYVVIVRAKTEGGDTVVAFSGVKTCSKDCEWLSVEADGTGKFTIKSKVPAISGKYSCAGLGSTNNTPELAAAYMADHGTIMTDAKVASVNGDGLVVSYTTLKPATTYIFIAQVTCVTGQTVTVCCPYRFE